MPIALVSASPRRIVDVVLRTVGAGRFRLVVAAEDAERGKPAPDPYLRAAAGLGVDPGDCVAVEDSPTGIAAALAAGCRVVAVPRAVPGRRHPSPAVPRRPRASLGRLRLRLRLRRRRAERRRTAWSRPWKTWSRWTCRCCDSWRRSRPR
nr:hypothetical protein GCM10020093_049110 [Planobispora longispora]